MTSAPLGAAAAIGGVVAIVSVLGWVRLAARLQTPHTGGIEPTFPSANTKRKAVAETSASA